jgi:hypothetical protein
LNNSSIIFAFVPQEEIAAKLRNRPSATSSIFAVALSNTAGVMEISRKAPGDRKAHLREEHKSVDFSVQKTTIDTAIPLNASISRR